MTRIDFRVLGPLEVLRDGVVVPVGAPKQRAVLEVLLLHANRPVPRDELIDFVWGPRPPRTARASLHNQIRALRASCGADTIELTEHGYRVTVESSRLDVARFRNLVREARFAEPKERATKLRAALACWRGPPFTALSGPAVVPALRRLEEERLAALEDRVDADLELGRSAELVAELEELVHANPSRERLWAQLMTALYRAGRQADALATYRRAHASFIDSLGVEPGVGLRELQRAMLVQDAGLQDPSRALGSTLERAATFLPRTPRERAESLYDYGRALVQLGEHEQARSALRAAQHSAASLGEVGLEQHARLALSHLSLFSGDTTMAEHLRLAGDVGSVLAGLGDEAGCATALRHQAHMARDLGRAEEGLRLALSALELAVRADDRSTVAACRRMVVQCLAHGPTPIDAAVAAARGELAGLRLDGAETAGVPCALGLLVAQAGHVADARGLVEQDLAAVRGASGAWQTVGCLILAGLMERAAGCLDDAEGHFETVYEMLSVANERSVLPAVAGQLACLAARRGDMVRAAALADECRAGSADGDFVSDALWRRARALVAATEARRDEVERLAVDVASVLEATDWLTFVGESFEDLAEAWAAMGDEPARRRALESALRAYEQRGSRSGVERTRTLPVLE